MGGYCVEIWVYRQYELPEELTAELKRKAELHETCTVTINLLELLGMVVTAWVMLELVGDMPAFEGDPVLMRATTSRRCRGSTAAAGQGVNGPVYS